MFLRYTTRKKNGKEHRYYSLVENRRVASGRVVQRHALYLGEINDSQEEAWRKTIEITIASTCRGRSVEIAVVAQRQAIRIYNVGERTDCLYGLSADQGRRCHEQNRRCKSECARKEKCPHVFSLLIAWRRSKGKGANLLHSDRGTAKRLGQRYGRPRPSGALAFWLCPGSLSNSRYPVRPSDYAKFVRMARFKTRPAVPSTVNSGRHRLHVVKSQTGTGPFSDQRSGW
jgi:hypothetical protein